MIVYKMLPDGGFVTGDMASQITAYAYPTSPHALVAKKHPKAVAEDMLDNERPSYRKLDAVKDYDRKNWDLLNGT